MRLGLQMFCQSVWFGLNAKKLITQLSHIYARYPEIMQSFAISCANHLCGAGIGSSILLFKV